MAIPSVDDYTINDDALTIITMLERVLATVISVYDEKGVPLPSRQYWTMGRAPEDCAQVTVSLIQVYLGTPGDQASTPQHCNQVRTAVLNVAVTRDFPVGENGKAVGVDRIMEASKWGAIDSMVLSSSLNDFDMWEDGYQGLGVIATIATNDPQGGVQTTNMNLSMAIG